MTTPHEHNRRAWDRLVSDKQRFTIAASDADFIDPLAKLDPPGWLGGNVRGKRLLCLGAGGGKHGPLYAAAGAIVTVVDISPAMLELDRDVARERGLTLRTVEASIDDLSMLAIGEFDLVVHPVSTCYVPAIVPVFRSVARVTAPHGVYVSQHKTPVSLQASQRPGAGGGYELTEPYYKRDPLPPVLGSRLREEGTLEYVHRWEEILGGLCRSGFAIEDAIEPQHVDLNAAPGEFGHRALYIAPYIRLKARRIGNKASGLILSDAR